MSVWKLYTQLFTRNWRWGRFAQSLSQRCSEKIRKKDIVMTTGRWLSWSIQILQFLMLWWPAMKAGSTAMTQRPRDRVSSGSMLALPDPRRPDRANPPTNFWWSLFLTALAWSTYTGFPRDRQLTRNTMSGIRDSRMAGSLLGMTRGVGGVRKSIHQTWLAKGLGLGLLCWGFKGVQEEIPSEEASTLQIGSVAFPLGQCTSPQLHPCHRLSNQDGHEDSSSASQ